MHLGPIADDFELRDPHTLPAAHNPYKCDLFRRRHPEGDSEPGAVDLFTAWLRDHPEDTVDCHYHRVPMAEAARLAATLLQWWQTQEEQTFSPRLLKLPEVGLLTDGYSDAAVDWAVSLLMFPITHVEEAPELVIDGQHRTCALKHAGVQLVPVCIR